MYAQWSTPRSIADAAIGARVVRTRVQRLCSHPPCRNGGTTLRSEPGYFLTPNSAGQGDLPPELVPVMQAAICLMHPRTTVALLLARLRPNLRSCHWADCRHHSHNADRNAPRTGEHR